MKSFTLAAFSVERRMAAVIFFRGSQLEGTRFRHLPADALKATESVQEFIKGILEHHSPEFVAISFPSSKAGVRIRSACEIIKEVSGGMGIPAVVVDDTTLMSAYGHPPLTRKEHVRDAGRIIWPNLSGTKSKRSAVDAALTGLYVQTERLFSIYSEQQ